MRKKMILLATAAMALLAFAAQSASADWYDTGVALEDGDDPHILATGPASFSSSAGGVACPETEATIELTGGTTDAHIVWFTVTDPKKCEVSGGLVFLTGGTTTLKSATLTGGATAKINAEKDDLTLTGVSLHNEYNNGFKLTLSSIESEPLTITVDNAKKVTTLTLEGKLNSTLGTTVTASADLHVDDATYGITP